MGNCSPVAGCNYWADPDGAALVYETAAIREENSDGRPDVRRRCADAESFGIYEASESGNGSSLCRQLQSFILIFHWEWEHLGGY